MAIEVDNYIIVKQGTTYSKISRETGISVDVLRLINETPDNRLQLGQKISLDYIIQPGDNFTRIGKKLKISPKLLLEWNPDVQERKMQIGKRIRITPPKRNTNREYSTETLYNNIRNSDTAAPVTNPTKAKAVSVKPIAAVSQTPKIVTPTTAPNTTKNASLEEYAKRQPAEFKPLVDFLKKEESVEQETYLGPDGHAHVGVGHKLTSQPAFITEIARSSKRKDFKANLKKALKNEKNRIVLASALESDLIDAVQKTGIKGVSTKVDTKTLKLTDAQIQLLLNGDIATARETAHQRIGKAIFESRKPHEKMVALDLFFNSGSNSPKFCEAFKKGDMKIAQKELDIFHSKKIDPKTKKEISRTYFLGLIKRNYKRMKILCEGNITPESQEKLLVALNKFRQQKGLPALKDFHKEVKPILEQP